MGSQTGLTMGQAGNFYGTTHWGGSGGYGTVFKLKHTSSGWVLVTLYSFTGGDDGGEPEASLTISPDGSLYGTTVSGGASCGSSPCGVVFRLQPPANALSTNWTETVIHRFTGSPDGWSPGYGKLIFDSAGNLYGTTANGGTNEGGTLYELTPSASRSNWTESILFNFGDNESWTGGNYGVVADSAGNLYGSAVGGGEWDDGSIYELSRSAAGWTLQNLYSFYAPVWSPQGGVILDPSGNLYGTTFFSNDGCCGNPQGGLVFSMTFSGHWYIDHLHDFGSAPHGPTYSLLRDGSGNLYGSDSVIQTLFELTYPSWSYTVLHTFSGGNDGGWPYGELISDAHGNLWGTTDGGGVYGYGVIWEVTF
jgi:uncharacterized repeat protein (TIGR03803 family)